jgi:predicted Fe-Mo cluster-binding NifX family protein
MHRAYWTVAFLMLSAAGLRAVGGRQKAVGNVLEEFQRIKKERGIDAASDFVRGRSK